MSTREQTATCAPLIACAAADDLRSAACEIEEAAEQLAIARDGGLALGARMAARNRALERLSVAGGIARHAMAQVSDVRRARALVVVADWTKEKLR